MKRVMFFQPFAENEEWTDEAIAGLVGQKGDAKWHGQPLGTGSIIAAKRKSVAGQQGLWITAELPDLFPMKHPGLFARCAVCGRKKWPWSAVVITRGEIVHRNCGLYVQQHHCE